MIEMIELEKVPETGYLLCYFQDRVEFCEYDSKDTLKIIFAQWKDKGTKLLEAHFFDEKEEYRLLSSRRKKGAISRLITDCDGQKIHEKTYEKEICKEETYEEEVLLFGEYAKIMKTIRIINYITYDKNDMLNISHYRLAPGKMPERKEG